VTRRRRRPIVSNPRRIEPPRHVHTDACKLTTREGGRVVTYRGRNAVTDWLKRVAEVARENRSA
jgi:hypothetical protein